MRSKMDSLIFMPDSITTNVENHVAKKHVSSLEQDKEPMQGGLEPEVEAENVERPVTKLYSLMTLVMRKHKMQHPIKWRMIPKKKIEAANTAVNRLIAGDFLESLGKELGLEVPPDLPLPGHKAAAIASQKKTADVSSNDENPLPVKKSGSGTHDDVIGNSRNGKTTENSQIMVKVPAWTCEKMVVKLKIKMEVHQMMKGAAEEVISIKAGKMGAEAQIVRHPPPPVMTRLMITGIRIGIDQGPKEKTKKRVEAEEDIRSTMAVNTEEEEEEETILWIDRIGVLGKNMKVVAERKSK